MSVLAKMTGGERSPPSASSTAPTEPPTRRTTGPTAAETAQDRDCRDLAETLAEFTPAMLIVFHGAVVARRTAGENPAGLEWRAVVDSRRRFDPAGWIRSAAASTPNEAAPAEIRVVGVDGESQLKVPESKPKRVRNRRR